MDEQKDKNNPSENFYEREFGGDSRPGVDLAEREKKPDGSHDNLGGLKPHEQAALDQMETGLREGNLYDASKNIAKTSSNASSMLKGAFSGRKKYGWIGGGIAGMVVAMAIFLFPTLGPTHILENLFDHNFGTHHFWQRNRTGTVIKTIFQANRTNRRLRDTPFTTKAQLIDFEKHERERMIPKGWSYEYDNQGKAIGLIDPEGKFIYLEDLSTREFNRTIQPLIDDTLPAWRKISRTQTRNLISTFTGPRRSFKWTALFSPEARQAEPEFNKRRYLKENGLESVPTADGKYKVVEDTGEVNEDGKPIYKDVEDFDQPIQDVLKGLDEGKTEPVVLSEATAAHAERQGIGGKEAGIVTMMVVGSCLAYNVYQSDLIGEHSRMASNMRIASTFMLGTDEGRRDGANIDEVGQFFNEYNNDSGTFTSTEAWRRATNQPVTGDELDVELRVIEDTTKDGFFESVFEGTGSLISGVPALGSLIGPICSIVGSTFFAVIGFFGDIVATIAGCLGTSGGACVLLVAKEVAFEGFFEIAMRMLAASITNITGILTSNPMQALAVLDQGLSLISTEESRAGTPVTSEEYNAEVALYMSEKNKNMDWKQRYFALENIQSLTARLAIAKENLQGSSPSQLVAGLFKLPINSLVAVTNMNNAFAQTDTGFDNYGFQKYSYNNDLIDSDPIAIAEEVSVQIENDEEVAENADEINDNTNLTRDFAVLCLGYDVEKGIVDKTAQSDMLPMFSDPDAFGVSKAKRRNDLYQKVCIEEATERSGLYTKVGRYTNDLELVTALSELTE